MNNRSENHCNKRKNKKQNQTITKEDFMMLILP